MPGSSPTMARREPTKRLKSVDLPTLGRPTMARSGAESRRSASGRARTPAAPSDDLRLDLGKRTASVSSQVLPSKVAAANGAAGRTGEGACPYTVCLGRHRSDRAVRSPFTNGNSELVGGLPPPTTDAWHRQLSIIEIPWHLPRSLRFRALRAFVLAKVRSTIFLRLEACWPRRIPRMSSGAASCRWRRRSRRPSNRSAT